MKRSDIAVGQTLQVTCAKYRAKGLDLVEVLKCGGIFALVRVADGQPAPRGAGHTLEGYYWFHPNELQLPQKDMPRPLLVGDRVRVLSSWTSPENLAPGEFGTVTQVWGVDQVQVLQDGLDKSKGAGGWCLSKKDVVHVTPEEDRAQAIVAQDAALRARGDTRLADNIAAARVTRTAAKVAAAIVANTKPKWETPGRHTITSYRSFRRYKAAGASFGVIPFNSSNRQPEKELVNISVSMARRRAQAGLSLVAVVSA